MPTPSTVSLTRSGAKRNPDGSSEPDRAHLRCMTVVTLFLVTLAGCSSKTYLMPTPTAYTQAYVDPFAPDPPDRICTEK